MIDIKKLRGVSLGGWLVLEKWITPSMFEGLSAQDEYSFMQGVATVEKIEKHRKEFITEADFRWLAENGFNAVRIPFGYWILDGDGPFTAGISYLDWAVEMAEKYDLQVLLCFHAAKGSQNGNDHSGKIGRKDWFKHREYRQQTVETLGRIAGRYKDSSAIWGIELLNEPTVGIREYFILRRFYHDAYRKLTKVASPGTRMVFSDGFVPRLFSGILKELPEYPVVMDVHWYQFGRKNIDSHFATLKKRPFEIRRLQRKQPIIIGEWSGMLSHLTLAGKNEYESTALEKEHIKLQLEAYQEAAGWFYWTYKTENDSIWNARAQIEKGSLSLP